MTLVESIQSLVAQVSKIGGETTRLLDRIEWLEAEVSRLDRLYSSIDQTPPAAPAGITAQALSSTSILVSWTAVTDPSGVTYTIESGNDGVLWAVLQSGIATTSYTHTVPRGVVRYYRVKAIDGASNASGYSSTASATTPANQTPVFASNITITAVEGVAGSVNLVATGKVTDPDGDPMTFGRTGGASDTATSAITCSSTSTIAWPALTAANYQIEVYADDGYSDALADWVARSTATGVVWANRFGDSSSDYWLRQGETSTATATRIGTGGIIGDGYLEIRVPQGQTPGTAGWGRPLAPVQAYAPLGIVADVNVAGKTALPMQDFFSYQGNEGYKKLANMRGGCFGNAAYYDTTQYYPGVPEFVHSGTFWLQFRCRLSASRMLATEHAGKLFILDHNSGGTAMGELVQGINADRWGSAWPRGMYWYTTQGRNELTNPQSNPGNYLPGSAYTSCNYPPTSANCWSMPADTWVTFNVGVTPGRQSVSSDGGYTFTTKYFDAGLIVRVAAAGATSWTTLISKSDFFWWYDAQFNNSIPAQWGWAGQQCPNAFNEIRFSMYNGGASNQPVLSTYTCDLDQILCSTIEPALPAV